MLPLVTAIVGGALGAWQARRRKGTGFDVAQWTVVWAIIGGLLGFVAALILVRGA